MRFRVWAVDMIRDRDVPEPIETQASSLDKATLLLAAGAVFQICVVMYFYANFDQAILRLMPDDAFYYLKIAENLSNGHGSVFSVGEPTNGYHPLWMAILAVVHWLINPTKEQFVLYTLLLAVIFNVLAAGVFGRLLRTFGFSKTRSQLGIALYLFLPWMVNLTLTGLETPIFFLCLFGFLLVTHKLLNQNGRLGLRSSVTLGATAGALMLARTDAVFFTVPAFFAILIRKKWPAVRPLIIAGLFSTLILSPWLTWNIKTFGTIEQSSSIAISVLKRYSLPPVSSLDYWKGGLIHLISVSYWAVITPFYRHAEYGPLFFFKEWAIAGTAIVGVSIAAAYYKKCITRDLKFPFVLWGPVLGLLSYFFFVRFFAQVWHLSTLFIVVIVFLLNFVPDKLKFSHFALFLLLFIPLTLYSLTNCYFYPQQTGVKSINRIRQAHADAPRKLRLCVTDAGYPSYFSKHTVINLDGVVNNRALNYIIAGRFSEYIDSQKCDTVSVDERRLDFYDRNLADAQ